MQPTRSNVLMLLKNLIPFPRFGGIDYIEICNRIKIYLFYVISNLFSFLFNKFIYR